MSSDVVYVPSSATTKDNDDIEVDDTEGGIIILAANEGRKSALIINIGDGDMRVTTDDSDPTEDHGKLIPAGASLNLYSPYCPTASVKGIRQGLTSTLVNASEVIG